MSAETHLSAHVPDRNVHAHGAKGLFRMSSSCLDLFDPRFVLISAVAWLSRAIAGSLQRLCEYVTQELEAGGEIASCVSQSRQEMSPPFDFQH